MGVLAAVVRGGCLEVFVDGAASLHPAERPRHRLLADRADWLDGDHERALVEIHEKSAPAVRVRDDGVELLEAEFCRAVCLLRAFGDAASVVAHVDLVVDCL